MENDDVTVHLPNWGTLILSVMGKADKKINALNICNKWHQFPFWLSVNEDFLADCIIYSAQKITQV